MEEKTTDKTMPLIALGVAAYMILRYQKKEKELQGAWADLYAYSEPLALPAPVDGLGDSERKTLALRQSFSPVERFRGGIVESKILAISR